MNVPPRKRLKSLVKTDATEKKENEDDEEEEGHDVDNETKVEESQSQNSDIDNPYLAATKLPRRDI